eukprot:430548-Pyramimonas_sp.AAC.1
MRRRGHRCSGFTLRAKNARPKATAAAGRYLKSSTHAAARPVLERGHQFGTRPKRLDDKTNEQ